MFEGKVMVWVLAFAFVVAAAGFVIHTSEIDELSREIREAEFGVQEAGRLMDMKKQTLVRREADVALARRELDTLDDLDTKIAAVLEDREAATRRLEELENAPEKIRQQFADAVAAVRKTALGESLGSVKLPSGAVLENTKIQKITDADITLAHGGGVTKLRAKNAPPELAARFRLKTESELEEMVKKAPAAEGAPPGNASPAGSAGTAAPAGQASDNSPAAIAAAAKREARFREIDSRMAELQVQTEIAERSRDEWKKQAEDYKNLHRRAQALGRISSHLIKANAATERANQIQTQLDSAKLLMEKLRQERDGLAPKPN